MNRLSIKLKITLWYTLVTVVISIMVVVVIASVSQNMIMKESTNRLIKSVDTFTMGPDIKPPDNIFSQDASENASQQTDEANSVENTEKKIGNDGSENTEKTSEGESITPQSKKAENRMKGMRDFHFFDQGVHIGVYDSEHILINGFLPFKFADDIELNDAELKEISDENKNHFLTYVRELLDENGDSMWVVGVVSIADESRLFNNVLLTNVIVTGVLIIMAAVGGYLIIKHAFKPVEKISQTAKAISESSDLSQRIDLGEGKDEIYRLAATFDEMLDKIENTLNNEKQFTSDASHELRTPVAVITSECEYVLDCVDDIEEAKDSVQSIKRQSDKMAKLISELLTISRMDRNTIGTSFEPTDISELLSFVCDEQIEIHDDKITLIPDIKQGIIADADHILLARLFINLISNAYQYGVEGGHIRVSLDEDDKKICFKVADDGIGIEKENLDKIWERFYQVDSSRTNSGGSMGLGLSMVKWIAEAHKGKINVESTIGEGTTFTFVMPKNNNAKQMDTTKLN